MSRPARSLAVFSVYVILLGLALLVIPDVWLPLYGLPKAADVWVRVVGMLLVLLAFYYVQAARHEMMLFIRWTVYTRASVILFLGVFVLLGLAEPPVLLVGVIDLSGAIWTGIELRRVQG
ncbi:MAG: hypothetical protein HXY41_10425 [Chloroflexi bacterium]|nr:hypothetical protein [Chloroflexota bacterium]